MTQRTRRGLAGTVLVVAALVIAAVVVTALRAEGREHTETRTNDGGAWLLKRDLGYVGHVNRAANEVESKVAVAASGADFETDQATDIVLVHDRSSGSAIVVDNANARRGTTIAGLTGDIVVDAVDRGVFVVDRATLRVWKFSADEFRSLTSLDGEEPLITGEGPGEMASFDDGHAVIADAAAGKVIFLRPDGSTERSPDVSMSDGISAITALGPDVAVVVDRDGDLTMVTPGEVRELPAVRDAQGTQLLVRLQQPGPAADHVIAVTTGGGIVRIPFGGGDPEPLADFGANADPVRPLVVGGCVFAVVQERPNYQQICVGEPVGDGVVPLGNSARADLRLRLVNGWVWINDVESGESWVTEPKQPLQPVEDWDPILTATADDPAERNDGEVTDNTQVIVDPDETEATVIDGDRQTDGPNLDPVARDDEAETQLERPTVVAVLANDSDPNGDVLIVTGVQPAGGAARIEVIPGGGAVQVTPEAGFVGDVTFGYTISDGRGGSAAANVVVHVTPADQASNRPPVTVRDVASIRRGQPVYFDVLANDDDPDGDALVLQSVELTDPETSAGTISMSASGTVTFTPDPNTSRDSIELTYVVADDAGATAEGTVTVDVRLEDANNEPDARNDFTTTVVNRAARLDLIDNDTDADNDPLYLAGQPEVIEPPGLGVGALDLSVTPDGELFFNPTEPGSYVLSYAVTDGFESDTAQVRIEVGEAVENRPPVAVRDDVVIPAGATRLVEVLDNDGDPDNDVVSIVDVRGDDHLRIEEADGAGFMVTVATEAPNRVTFAYAISDGASEPVWTSVVVAVIDAATLDEAPVARDDTAEARAGGRISVPILDNDSDPELGVLEVTSVSAAEGVDAAIGLNGQTVELTIADTVTTTTRVGYTIRDTSGNQASAVISVAIVPPEQVNRPPIARTDTDRTRAGVPVIIDIVANDSDLDGDMIAAEGITGQPGYGTAEIIDGQLVYTPAETFSGTDRVSYALVDAFGGRAVGEVLIGVLGRDGANRNPFAADDRVEVIAGSATIRLDALANDSDPDHDQLLVTRVGDATTGEITVAADAGSLEYTPPTEGNADGTPIEVTVPYAIADGRGGVDDATVQITVLTADEPLAPIAADDLLGPLSPGQRVEIDLLVNDVDPDGIPEGLEVTWDDAAMTPADEHGVVTVTAGTASARHQYTITDADGLSSTATLSVLVVDNQAPVVTMAEAEVEAGGTVELDVAELAGVVDPDGDPLSFACCDDRVGGTTDVATTGASGLVVRFTPDAGFVGRASFSYEVDDGEAGHTTSGVVTITVTAATNTVPVVTDGSFEVVAGTATPVDLTGLVTDPDPDDTATFTIGETVGPVEVALQDGRVAVVTTAIDQSGQAGSFQFTVTDNAGDSATGTVNLAVQPSDQPAPEAIGDQGRTRQGEAVTIAVLDNDVDHLGQGLAVSAVGVTSAGVVTTDGRLVTFTPNAEFFGTATFNYTAQDARRSVERQADGQVSVVVVGRPTPPGTPSATADNGTAVVTWAPSDGNGAGVTGYEVSGGGQTVATDGATTASFSNLPNGVPVTFTVVAINEAGRSDPSAPSAPVTPDVVPGRPAAPTVRFADSALIVTWSAPANDGSPIEGYNLMIGGSATGVQATGSGTSYRWEGLANGSEYTFQVQARNARGVGEWSTPSSPEHPLTTPSAPTSVVGASGDRYIDVTFVPGADGGESPSAYEVRMVSSGAVVTTQTTTRRWSDLPNGEAQSFEVRAVNRAGTGPWSAASAPVVPCGVPGAPANVAATRGDGRATVTWGAAASNGCAITSYVVVSSGGTATSVNGGQLSATVGGLTNGTSYTFTVTAINEKGETISAASNAVVPAGPPCAPSNLQARPDIKAIDATWSAGCDNGAAITDYQMSINGGGWQSVGADLAHRATGLADSTDYSLRVRAVNDVGAGPVSNTASARTPGPPDTPGCFSTSSGNGRVEASWCRPNDNGDAINHFQVERSPGGTQNVTGTSISYTNVSNGTAYQVRVRACNDVGCSSWTGWRTETPRAPVSVTISKGASAVGEDNCTHSSCRWINVQATGLTPGATYSISCASQDGGFWDTPSRHRVDGSGRLTANGVCYYGYPGRQVWVTVASHRSNVIVW
ncbi:MAG: Ig-like domain-containing protein [Desertimonas sp.]